MSIGNDDSASRKLMLTAIKSAMLDSGEWSVRRSDAGPQPQPQFIGFNGTVAWTGWFVPRKPPPPAALPPDSLWHRVYLLGYYDAAGEPYLTTWSDGPDTKYIDVVVIGAGEWMPYWSNPVPEGCSIEPMREDLNLAGGRRKYREKVAYATSRGGVYAFGWLLDRDLKREPPRSFWADFMEGDRG